MGEIQKRVRRTGGSVRGGASSGRVVAHPEQCPDDASTLVNLAVLGVLGPNSGWGVSLQPQNACGLSLGTDAESFVVCADARPSGKGQRVIIFARSDRGLMLGAGRLLRSLDVDEKTGQVTVPPGLSLAVEPPPFGRMRGHQLTDWGFYMTTEFFEDYAKELLVFGTNQIEFAHIDYTRGDQHKLVAWSAICDKYDLRVSLFNPPFSTDQEKATTLQVFANMSRVDSIFHEGGGAETFATMEAQVDALHKHHPGATAWLSPCGLDEVALDGTCQQPHEYLDSETLISPKQLQIASGLTLFFVSDRVVGSSELTFNARLAARRRLRPWYPHFAKAARGASATWVRTASVP